MTPRRRPALAAAGKKVQVTLLPVPERVKFLFAMTEEERQQEVIEYENP